MTERLSQTLEQQDEFKLYQWIQHLYDGNRSMKIGTIIPDLRLDALKARLNPDRSSLDIEENFNGLRQNDLRGLIKTTQTRGPGWKRTVKVSPFDTTQELSSELTTDSPTEKKTYTTIHYAMGSVGFIYTNSTKQGILLEKFEAYFIPSDESIHMRFWNHSLGRPNLLGEIEVDRDGKILDRFGF